LIGAKSVSNPRASFSPDVIDLVSPGLGIYTPFTVHVLAVSLEGNGMRGVEFGVDLMPAGAQIIAVEYPTSSVLNIVQPPDFIIGFGFCLPTNNFLYRIATIHVIATEQEAIESGFIQLRPAVVQSIPDRLAYVTCQNGLEGSEYNSTAQALAGPPLYFSPQTGDPTAVGKVPRRSQITDSYPNPFNPETTIRFDAAEAGLFEIRIVDTAGRRVWNFEKNVPGPGTGYEIRWDGKDARGALQQAACTSCSCADPMSSTSIESR
jgi:hypothetical protein